MQISLDGRLVDQAAAGLSILDRGLTLGDGLFETLGVRDREILRLDAHLRRLRSGLEMLSLPLQISDTELVTRLLAVIAVNDLAHGSLRLTVTRGQGPRGLLPPPAPSPTILITAAPFATRAVKISAVISRRTCRNEHSPLSRIKAIGYLDNILALIDAKAAGADDALLLNTQTRLASATAANLFAVIDGDLLTPPLADGVLPGIVRAEILARQGAVERSLAGADLSRATELILTNSLGLRSIVTLDEARVGTGAKGPVAAALAKTIAFPG